MTKVPADVKRFPVGLGLATQSGPWKSGSCASPSQWCLPCSPPAKVADTEWDTVGQSLMPHFTREEAEVQRGAGLAYCHTVRDLRVRTLTQASSLQCGVLLLAL